MISILLQTIKDRAVSLISFTLGGLAFIWMYILLFPTIQGQGETYSQLLENFPEDLGKVLGIAELDFSTFESFLVAEQFNLIWAIIVMFMLISWAGKSIAGEVEKGTFDVLLANPISRARIYLGKYFSGIVALCVYIVFSVLVIIPLAEMHSVAYDAKSYFVFSVMGFLFGTAILGTASMLSAIFSEKGSVYKIMGGMIVGMYVLNIIAVLQDRVEFLKYFSFFYYMNVSELLLDQQLSGISVAVFLIVGVTTAVAGMYIINKKDISVV